MESPEDALGLLLIGGAVPPESEPAWFTGVFHARSSIRFCASSRSPTATAARAANARCSTASSTPSATRFCSPTRKAASSSPTRAALMRCLRPRRKRARAAAAPVGLNNMLLSSALSAKAIELRDRAPRRRELLLVDPMDELRPGVRAARHGSPGSTARQRRRFRAAQRDRPAAGQRGEFLGQLPQDARWPRSWRAPSAIGSISSSTRSPIRSSSPMTRAAQASLMNAPAERLFTGGPDGDDAADRSSVGCRPDDAHFSSFIAGLLVGGRQNRRRRRRDFGLQRSRDGRRAAAVRSHRRQGPLRGRRAHCGRHHPARPIRGASRRRAASTNS